MNKNTSVITNQISPLRLEVGDKLNLFCSSNVYKTKITTEDNTEVIMPSKNYFFVEDRLYIPYNNYVTDECLQIPYQYRYIKVDKIKYPPANSSIEESYKLLICDENGAAYHFNYNQFYIPVENIVEKSKEINLQELYNIQEENGNLPLFKIVPEKQNAGSMITCATILDLLHNSKELGKLSPESLQYKYYTNEKDGIFILNYSDIRKYQINPNRSIDTHNIVQDVIQNEIKSNPIYLVVQNGKCLFTDIRQEENLVKDYKTALKVLHNHFRMDESSDDSIEIDVNKQFIFKITKSDLLIGYNKNFASVVLEGNEIPLIPPKNTYLFFDHGIYFQHCNNVREVFNYDAPFSGFTKNFFNIAQKKLDSDNVYLAIKVDGNNQIKMYFSDNKENIIYDLPNTTLTQHLSTILPLEYPQNNTHDGLKEESTNTAPIYDAEDSNSIVAQHNSKKENLDHGKLPKNKDDATYLTQDSGTVYFPLPKKNVIIGDSIDQDKHHILLSMTYEEMLDIYRAIQESYSYEYVISAYENIFKNYGREQISNDAYIDSNSHIFINGYDFGLLQH